MLAAGLHWSALMPEGGRALLEEQIDGLRAAHAIPPCEVELVGREDRVIPVMMVSALVDVERSRVASLCLDVSDQVQARRDAERASAEKSRFLTVMTHELRTPLNTIKGQAALLQEGVYGAPTDPQRTALERVERAERRLRHVIDEVLAYSRLETGQVTYTMSAVPLAPLFAEVAEAVGSQCAAKRQTLTVASVDPALAVRADADKLRQALTALLSNAIKFTPLEGMITIDTAARQEVPRFVFVRVTDSGVGLPPEQFESIFEPFAQADARRARAAEGLGLGLTITRDLVRGMGGDVRVRSRPGAGATFTIALPRA